MKYIKLFEQFEEEESWWDEESPFDKSSFEAGDWVVCIDDNIIPISMGGKRIFEKGKKYQVKDTRVSRGILKIAVFGIRDFWYSERFEKTTPPKAHKEDLPQMNEQEEWWEEESPFDNLQKDSEEFIIGDWVICIDNSRYEGFIQKGEKYKIEDIFNANRPLLKLFNVDYVWFAKRFEKTTPPTEINEEYKYFKFDNKVDNPKDRNEPFFNEHKKKYRKNKKIKDCLDVYFGEYLTYDKYLNYKDRLEEVGYDVDYFWIPVSFNIRQMDGRWWVDEDTSIYFYKKTNRISVIYGDCLNKDFRFNKENIDYIIDFLIDLKTIKKKINTHKDIDPFGEEKWNKEKWDEEEIFGD